MSETHTRPDTSPALRTINGTTVVALQGEIDLVTSLPLAAHLDALTSAPSPDLVLDLRAVSFIDCTGLGVLCRMHNRVRERGGRLRLVTGSARMLRILRLVGLGGVFEVHPQLPMAPARTPTAIGDSRVTMG